MKPSQRILFGQIAIFSIVMIGSTLVIRALVATAPAPDTHEALQRTADLYATDTHGGTTPEETYNLFVATLKAGDTEAASRYFIPDVQPLMLEKLRSAAHNKLTEQLVVLLEQEKRGIKLSPESYQFSIEIDDSQFTIDLVLNTASLVWKLEAF